MGARFSMLFAIAQLDGVMGMCGFATCKDSEVCCCNATSGQSGYCVEAGSDASVCTGSTMCQNGESCCAKELQQVIKDDDICPGVGKTCDQVGSDGLPCCGAEHGAGFAFCQISPEYRCCGGTTYAISCPSTSGCSVNDAGIPLCQNDTVLEAEVDLEISSGADFVCHGLNYNITCGPQYTACCGENTIAPLCMDAAGHSCCKDEDLNLAVTCEKGQKCNKGPQCTAGSMMV